MRNCHELEFFCLNLATWVEKLCKILVTPTSVLALWYKLFLLSKGIRADTVCCLRRRLLSWGYMWEGPTGGLVSFTQARYHMLAFILSFQFVAIKPKFLCIFTSRIWVTPLIPVCIPLFCLLQNLLDTLLWVFRERAGGHPPVVGCLTFSCHEEMHSGDRMVTLI